MPNLPTSLRAAALTLTLLLLTGCAAGGGTQAVPPYARLVADLQAERSTAWDQLDRAFLRLPDFQDRLERLGVLHSNIGAVPDGDVDTLERSAEEMLGLYYGDLRAHQLRHRLALAADEAETAAFHGAAADAIEAAIAASGDGSMDAPYAVISAPQAFAWLEKRRTEVVGALYTTDDDLPQLLLVAKVRRTEGRALQELRFDLTPTFKASTALTGAVGEGARPSQVVAARAVQGDSAAQAAYAITLWQQGPEYGGRAVQWLQSASESGNLIAREMLGVIYGSLASGRSGEEAQRLLDAAVDQFLLAVNQGSDTAMYNLAQLYLSGHFGEENQPAGVALMEQAAERDNLDALVMLARLHYNGQFVARDRDRAVELLARASARGHTEAQLFHARHMLSTDDGSGFDAQALAWLEEAATRGGSTEAMVLLGTLHAQGEHAALDLPAAKDWFARAAAGTDDAETINSIAWIFAVAEKQALRDPQAALALMDALMTADPDAATNPAYIDTWAACYAVNGRFEDAVAVQTRAVEIAEAEAEAAEDGEAPAYLPVLREHLDLFRAGGTVTEDVP
ncbi:MAG TPA: tetratricopeptide repeat protein [Pseudomonadales bacterium]|nr:tetratricopeptide repeat protein [Pseudomonadales bacterium]